jgi:hypothetical protein
MKITLRNKKPIIDIDSFNKKADVIFKDVVIPQIKKYKSMEETLITKETGSPLDKSDLDKLPKYK